mgnify:FL=1
MMSVTLSKLSLRNARRQARDYLVYFGAMVMAAALLYSFNGLMFSEEILTLSKSMNQMPLLIVMVSIVVVCVFGWLVSYSTGFILARRSRELGTYLLIGLENRQVARLFFQENLVVGGCALALGLLLGSLLFQAMRAMVFALFGQAYHFSIAFSLSAAGLTAVYFVLIYLLALGRSRRRIRKTQICDLIYFDKRNEGALIGSGKKRRGLFAVSMVFGIVGALLMMAGDLTLGMVGAGCLIAFLYGFFLSFASAVPAFFDKCPARKYKGQRLLVFRTLTAKLATMGVLMATMSMIFTATLVSEGMGLVCGAICVGGGAEKACFALYSGTGRKEEIHREYLDYIDANISVVQCRQYSVYESGEARIIDYVKERETYNDYGYRGDPIIGYSDYAALRVLAGYETVEPIKDKYIIHCMSYLEGALKGYDEDLVLGGVALSFGGVHTEHFLQRYGEGNGYGFILVVPDEVAMACAVHHSAYAAKTSEPVSEGQYYDICAIREEVESRSGEYDAVYSKTAEEAEAASGTATAVFPLYFLALALTMTAATILTIQQLAESGRYKRQFDLLHRLGMDVGEMKKALGLQSAIYYAMPAIPSLLMGVPILLNLAKMPEPGIMVGWSSPAAVVGIAVGMFFLIYGIYILLAYISLRRNVLPEE